MGRQRLALDPTMAPHTVRSLHTGQQPSTVHVSLIAHKHCFSPRFACFVRENKNFKGDSKSLNSIESHQTYNLICFICFAVTWNHLYYNSERCGITGLLYDKKKNMYFLYKVNSEYFLYKIVFVHCPLHSNISM